LADTAENSRLFWLFGAVADKDRNGQILNTFLYQPLIPVPTFEIPR